MELTTGLTADRRQRVEARLHANLMAWLTTVDPTGRPDTVPVWFLVLDDEKILIYSQPHKPKLRNLETNPNIALGLDVTDIGRDIVRIEGTAVHAPDHPPADRVDAYTTKYAERLAAMFGSAAQFAAQFSEAIVVTPSRLHA